MPRKIRRAYRGPYDSWQNRIATLRFVQDIPLTSADVSYGLLQQTQENLYRFQQTPMLICWGERDFIFDGDFLKEWIRRFPQAQVHRFPEAGHYVLEEQPAAIVPLIRDFLAAPLMSSPTNIAAHLSILSIQRPAQPALLSRHGVVTFLELEQRSNCCAQGLKEIGIQRGTRTVLMVTPGVEFLVLTFALIKLNAVLILVDPGMGWHNVKKCLEESKPEAFVGAPLAQMARILFGWGRGSVKICLTVGGFPTL